MTVNKRTPLGWSLLLGSALGLALALLAAVWLATQHQTEILARIDQWQTRGMFVTIDADTFDPGPALHSHFPGVQAVYQGRPISLLQPLAGERGLVLAVLRSPLDSPFCLLQMHQLNKLQSQYQRSGIALVAITHETPARLASLAAQYDLTLPILSDVQTLSFRTLGLLDIAMNSGHADFGMAYPGFILISPEGVVLGKWFLADPQQRMAGQSVLEQAQRILETPPLRRQQD